ncbi:MAG: DUF1847 domain-containing protein [Deltaproteobacteria bacterium]|jgi:uncharacterized metal-binding protein|nr:DUF1847 domain-containing protein [Deltaproteobacteria bacterium]MBT4266760.1 DUF1847 domain-containing protein [Deltaproteobacteria bacterium]MBT4643724.1 DUF1847 domain-containing protein [Deltaproteobacteria bacterium]MBT6503290.1 DUF1847 domain-containing protein [Deltaproteobacteria bacterium]MBT7151968.1 DUF1847 domain-containing protein [Deltaproteobacteria bacterium]
MKNKSKKTFPTCASCEIEMWNRRCIVENGEVSKGCPTVSRKKVLQAADELYNNPEHLKFARQASIQEGDGYDNKFDKESRSVVLNPIKTRIVEVCEFAKKMAYQRIGLAFCIGLAREAAIVEEVLQNHDFEVVSVVCKAGCVPKERIGVNKEEFIVPEIGEMIPGASETMCNPIFQAEVLNNEKTDFNVVIGLCVGHDSLFFKHADAYTTVLAVKDRVTGHNPLAAIYQSSSYYRKIMQ